MGHGANRAVARQAQAGIAAHETSAEPAAIAQEMAVQRGIKPVHYATEFPLTLIHRDIAPHRAMRTDGWCGPHIPFTTEMRRKGFIHKHAGRAYFH